MGEGWDDGVADLLFFFLSPCLAQPWPLKSSFNDG